MKLRSLLATAAAPRALMAAGASLLAIAGHAPAFAQSAVESEVPPVASSIDKNGVDVVTGRAVATPMSVSIGPGGPGSLSYSWATSNEGQGISLGFITVDAATDTHFIPSRSVGRARLST
ncbi:MAG: hypothetical protein WDN44_14205 [Sphingomonas sp.]